VRFSIEHHGIVSQVSVPVTGGGLVAIAVQRTYAGNSPNSAIDSGGSGAPVVSFISW
jgi:hypothetical protein